MDQSVEYYKRGSMSGKVFWTEMLFTKDHILLHDLSAKGLSTSSENLELERVHQNISDSSKGKTFQSWTSTAYH